MFAKSQGPIPGMNFAFPDVCKTPPFAIPAPFPNIALSMMAIPTVFNQFIMGMPAHNLMTMDAISNGDEAGAMGGVVSQIIVGPSRHIMGSTNVFCGPAPATKMLDPTAQNGPAPNAVGTMLSPSQIKVMYLR